MNPCFCVQQARPRRGDFETSPITVTNKINQDYWVTITSHSASNDPHNVNHGLKHTDRHKVPAKGSREFKVVYDPSQDSSSAMNPLWYKYYLEIQSLNGTVLLKDWQINPVDVTIDFNITQPPAFWEE